QLHIGYFSTGSINLRRRSVAAVGGLVRPCRHDIGRNCRAFELNKFWQASATVRQAPASTLDCEFLLHKEGNGVRISRGLTGNLFAAESDSDNSRFRLEPFERRNERCWPHGGDLYNLTRLIV